MSQPTNDLEKLSSNQRILRRIWLEEHLETFTRMAGYYRNVGPDILLPKQILWERDQEKGFVVLK